MSLCKTLHVAENYDQMSQAAEHFLAEEIRRKPNALLSIATGQSPAGLYSKMVERHRAEKTLFASTRFIKLDEWGGLAMSDPGSCESYIQARLLRPMRVPQKRYFAWQSQPEDPQAECVRVARWLEKNGPIDINILGIGLNGHLGLNEPEPALCAAPHAAQLTKASLGHNMLSSKGGTVRYGLTLGMDSIMKSRMVLLLVSGKAKAKPLARMLSGEVSTRFPATFLTLHPELHVFCDREAAAKLPVTL